MKLTILPVTPERWTDLEAIFKARGCAIARSCWCMAYRRSGSQAQPPPGMTRAEVNRAQLKAFVDAGRPPGLVGYRGEVPVGWVSIGPREEYARLARSPIMKPIDDQSVWSVICFVVPAEYRGRGVAEALLADAVGLLQEEWSQANRGLSCRQAEPRVGRFHVVWREVDVSRSIDSRGACCCGWTQSHERAATAQGTQARSARTVRWECVLACTSVALRQPV